MPTRSNIVLLVDDNNQFRKLVSTMLASRGYRCVACATAKEAETALRNVEQKPGVCILDLNLSHNPHGAEPDGMETLRATRRQYSDVPIVVLTGYEGFRTQALENGATVYLTRPVEIQFLLFMVDVLAFQAGGGATNDQLFDRIRQEVGPHSLRLFFNHLLNTQDFWKVMARNQEVGLVQNVIDAMDVEVMVLDTDSNVRLLNRRMREANNLDADAIGRKCFQGVCQVSEPCVGCAENPANRGWQTGRLTLERNGRNLLASFSEIRGPGHDVRYRIQVGTNVTRRTQAWTMLQGLPRTHLWGPNELAWWVVEQIKLMGYTRVCLYRWEETRGTPQPAANPDLPMFSGRLVGWECSQPEFGHEFARHILASDDELANEAIRLRRPILVEGERLKKIVRNRPFPIDDVCRVLKVPLLAFGKPVGMLCIEADSDELLASEDVEIMALLAPAVADALRSAIARLGWESREKRWLEAIRKIDAILTTGDSSEEVFRVMVENISEVLGALAGWIVIRNQVSSPLRLVVATNPAFTSDLAHYEHPGDRGVIGRCMRRNCSEIVDNLWNDADFLAHFETMAGGPVKEFLSTLGSLVLAPVRQGTQPIGVLALGYLGKASGVTKRDLTFLDDVCSRIGITLAKIANHKQLEVIAIQQTKLGDLALLSSGVSHALRTPLAIIRGALDLIIGETDPDAIRDNVARANTAIDRALQLIGKLVSWATPAGMTPNRFYFREIIADIRQLLADKLRDNNIVYREEIDDDAPPVFAPPDGLRMAILDLYVNAAKAMPGGGELTVSVFHDDGRVYLRVRDTGRGITADRLKRLIDYDNIKPAPAGGIGLGLYLAQRVIAASGGTFHVESKPGEGSTFTIGLPAASENGEGNHE